MASSARDKDEEVILRCRFGVVVIPKHLNAREAHFLKHEEDFVSEVHRHSDLVFLIGQQFIAFPQLRVHFESDSLFEGSTARTRERNT